MDYSVKSRYNQQETAFYAALILCAAVFPFSEALISIAAGLLLLQVFIFQSWQHPSVKSRKLKILLFPVSVFLIYLVETVFTKDSSFALYELKKVIFWLIIPLAVFLSPKLPDKKVYFILFVFVLSVFASSLIITGRLLFRDTLQFSDFRAFSIISHIRFSIQVGFALVILCWFLLRKKSIEPNIPSGLIFFLIILMVLFLVLLKSLIGILSFLGTLIIAFALFAGKIENRKIKFLMRLTVLALFLIPVIYVGKVVNDFYDFKNVNPEDVEHKTLSGNLYHHDFNQYTRENGHLVYIYICDVELREEWNKRSKIKYDDTLNGYPLGSTLIRYLTSLGYRKDSVGVSLLTAEDIELIQEGVTNYKFKNHFFSLYPRIYETVWEFDYYIRTNDPNNKSLAQRIEFIKASLVLIKQNPLLGIGTGNSVLKYNEAYENMNTKLLREKWRPSHNQYLNYVVKFGFIGFFIIALAIIMPVLLLKQQYNFILTFFLIFIAFANLGDANLETHTGLSFFVFFYSFLIWNSTDLMKKSILK